MTIELPPLPEPNAKQGEDMPSPEGGFWTDLFDTDQMRAYAQAAVLAERERCAQIAENYYSHADDVFELDTAIVALGIAASIRYG